MTVDLPLLATSQADDDELIQVAGEFGAALAERGWTIATAESCTGGGIARALTETSGSSAWFDCAFVTYSNEAKQRMLGVPEKVLAEHGAVSRPVATAMAEGVLARSPVTLAIAVTGVAGPTGGSPGKPVGTVWFGFARRVSSPAGVQSIDSVAECHCIDGDRRAVRLRTALHAIRRLTRLWL